MVQKKNKMLKNYVISISFIGKKSKITQKLDFLGELKHNTSK